MFFLKARTRNFYLKRFCISCGLFFCATLTILLPAHHYGLKSDSIGYWTIVMPSCICALVFISTSLVYGIKFGNDVLVRKYFPLKYLLVLLLLPATFLGIRLLQIPGFTDGVADHVRQLGITDQLIDAAAQEIQKPDTYLSGMDRGKELTHQLPFSQLNLKSTPSFIVRNSTLIILCGSGMTMGWGIAISGEKEKAPVLRNEGFTGLIPVSKEIVVFYAPG